MMENTKNKYLQKASESPIHVGEMLKKYIDSKRIFKSSLARKLNRSDSTILQYQKGKTMQIAILVELTHALKHNFFSDIAALFPPEYSSSEAVDNSKDLRIAELEQKILILEAEKAVLVSVMKN